MSKQDEFVEAIGFGKVEVAKRLLAQGDVDVNAQTSGGSVAIIVAVSRDAYNAIRWLVADVHADVNVTDSGGYTALWRACEKGRDEVARYLLDVGADVNPATVTGLTLLDVSVEHDSLWKNLGNFGVSATAIMWFAEVVVSFLVALVIASMFQRCWFDGGPFDPNARRWGTLLLNFAGITIAVLFYIPFMKQLMGVFDCTRQEDGTLTLDASNGQEQCYVGAHLPLTVPSPPLMLGLTYFSFRLLGTNGWYRGVHYDDDKHCIFRWLCWYWGIDDPVLFVYEWHLFMASQWLPLAVAVFNKTLELALIAVSVYFSTFPRVQLYASLVLSLLSVLLVIIYPHQYWRRPMSLVYGASKYVLLATWTLAAAVYEDFVANESQYMLTQPGGDKGPTFITNGPVQLWHYALLFIGSFVVGLGCQALAMLVVSDPSDTAAFIKKEAEKKRAAEEAENEASDDDSSDDDATIMTADDGDVDAVDAVDEPASVELTTLEAGSVSPRARRVSRRLSSKLASTSATAAGGSSSPPHSPRRRRLSSKLSPRSLASASTGGEV